MVTDSTFVFKSLVRTTCALCGRARAPHEWCAPVLPATDQLTLRAVCHMWDLGLPLPRATAPTAAPRSTRTHAARPQSLATAARTMPTVRQNADDACTGQLHMRLACRFQSCASPHFRGDHQRQACKGSSDPLQARHATKHSGRATSARCMTRRQRRNGSEARTAEAPGNKSD